jgi:hypothetical protein
MESFAGTTILLFVESLGAAMGVGIFSDMLSDG